MLASLLQLLDYAAGVPQAPVIVVGGHYGKAKRKPEITRVEWEQKTAAKRRVLIEQALRALHAAPEDIRDEVAEIVAPFVPDEAADRLKVAKRQMEKFTADFRRVERLLALYLEYLDEEDELFMMLMP